MNDKLADEFSRHTTVKSRLQDFLKELEGVLEEQAKHLVWSHAKNQPARMTMIQQALDLLPDVADTNADESTDMAGSEALDIQADSDAMDVT